MSVDYIYIHVYMCTIIDTDIYMYLHTCILGMHVHDAIRTHKREKVCMYAGIKHMHPYIHTNKLTCKYKYKNKNSYATINVYMDVHIYMQICIYVYMNIHINIYI